MSFPNFLRPSQNIYVSTLKFRFFEKTKKICRNLIFYIYWVKGTWISLLYNYILVIRDAQPIIFPSTGRNSFFILPINLNCHIAQKSQILPQKNKYCSEEAMNLNGSKNVLFTYYCILLTLFECFVHCRNGIRLWIWASCLHDFCYHILYSIY